MNSNTTTMNPELLDAFGSEIEAVKQRALADRGERDARYIKKLMRIHDLLTIGARLSIFASLLFLPAELFGFSIALNIASWPLFWLLLSAGSIGLGIAKILDNMEIGHNIIHGQYDWMGDPRFHSRHYDWDTNCPGSQWANSHNYEHHTYTNILGKDRDIGYGILRMDPAQKWHPAYLANPVFATLLMLLFDMGVALHDVEMDSLRAGRKTFKDVWPKLKQSLRKTAQIWGKDFILYPALAGPFFPIILAANASASVIRNIWSFSIIFCGHFPDGVHTFTEASCENESRGQWYYRQLLGSANLSGGKLFHVMSGNLSHQIEHHLFPDVPAHRYAEMSVEVRQICEKYGLPYNTGPLYSQYATVWMKIFKLALPPRNTPRPLAA
ncbi:fatty acid desaturase [Zhongshania guokunii]|uniref:Fatty acid desaturase n=1 Tax=Zhongshania guokunii TaxID=641783 RepID=A0ABV3U2J1_9GAMM